jgi:hypothetical protein
LQWRRWRKQAAITFFFMFEKKKKVMAMRHHLFLWFYCGEEGDDK